MQGGAFRNVLDLVETILTILVQKGSVGVAFWSFGVKSGGMFHWLILSGATLRLWVFFAGALFLSACGSDQSAVRRNNAETLPADGDAEVAAVLAEVMEKHQLPGMAAAIVTSQGVARMAAVGVRKSGTTVKVTVQDLWHLGSETKAMTASLVGLLVERGGMRWDTTVGEVFPEMVAGFHPATTNITMTELLSHRAGLSANLRWAGFKGRGTVQQQRIEAMKEALASEPEKPRGAYHYSNLGYVIAGAMIEKVLGQSWEEAMRREVFEPLKMTRVGYGGVGTPGTTDQPWGHLRSKRPTRDTGPGQDNPPVLGPAGRVHCPLEDWARFISDQLQGSRGKDGLLKAATYERLHTPQPGSDYALGWVVAEREWGGGKVLNHAGCNTMFYANVWLAPQRDFAVLVCINQGDDVAAKASDEAVGALIRLRASKLPAGSN